MLSPTLYFRELKRVGFRVRSESRIRSPDDYWGTSRRRTVSTYVASYNFKGHIIAIDGDVHLIGDDLHVSARILFTSSLLQAINPLIEMPTFSSVTAEELDDIFRFVNVAQGQGVCTDYELVNGGKLRR